MFRQFAEQRVKERLAEIQKQEEKEAALQAYKLNNAIAAFDQRFPNYREMLKIDGFTVEFSYANDHFKDYHGAHNSDELYKITISSKKRTILDKVMGLKTAYFAMMKDGRIYSDGAILPDEDLPLLIYYQLFK